MSLVTTPHIESYRLTASIQPPDSLGGIRIHNREGEWTIDINNGIIVLSTTSDKEKDKIWAEADKQLQLVVNDLAWEGIRFSAAVRSCETSSGTTVQPTPATANASVGRVIVLVNGEIPSMNYPAWSRNPIALRARDYYLKAEANPEYVMHNLYKAIEHLKPKKVRWEDFVTRNLGLAKKHSKDFLSYVTGRANDGKYDERHPPEPGNSSIKLPEHEIEECKGRVRNLIEGYAKKHSA